MNIYGCVCNIDCIIFISIPQVCLGLRFLASGALYSACGDTQGVNKSTVCRAVWAFVNYLNSISSQYVFSSPTVIAHVSFVLLLMLPLVLAIAELGM